jgi:hypothetical protein
MATGLAEYNNLLLKSCCSFQPHFAFCEQGTGEQSSKAKYSYPSAPSGGELKVKTE